MDNLFGKLGFSKAFIAEIENAKMDSETNFTQDSYYSVDDYSSDCQDMENYVITESEAPLTFDSFIV